MTTSVTPSTTRPKIICNRAEMRAAVKTSQSNGKQVGVVMTMGALHEGHISLVKECTQQADVTVVTIFVNPTQFLPGEDFEKYPRDLQRDLAILEDCDIDFVFAPTPEEMYGNTFSTFIQPPKVGDRLEGVCRPGHFRGVCTIVFKLLQAVPANVALFGHKDYQQYLVLKSMAKDLDLETEIRVCPTIREPDGLALSSRNSYLSEAARVQALAISRSLLAAADSVRHGARDVAGITDAIRRELDNARIEKIDYVAVVDADTLEEISVIAQPAVALVAVFLGNTRLIDNVRLEPLRS